MVGHSALGWKAETTQFWKSWSGKGEHEKVRPLAQEVVKCKTFLLSVPSCCGGTWGGNQSPLVPHFLLAEELLCLLSHLLGEHTYFQPEVN